MKLIYLLACSILLLTGTSHAQFIWNDAAGDSFYSDPGNWVGNTAPPATGADIVIGTMQNGDNIVGIDTAGNVTVNSWTFAATLNGLSTPVQVLNDGSGQQLTITSAGGITNSSNLQNEFDVVVNAGANTTFNGGTTGLNFQNALNISHFNVTTTGTVTIAPGQDLIFDINNTSTYGKVGSVITTGVIIQVVGNSYTAHAGDTFDLTSASFTGAILGTLPTLSAGLVWDTSGLFSSGVLTVDAVPEPSTYALLLGGFVLLVLHKRRSIFFGFLKLRK
jgi:hypothetical protein